MVMGNWCAAGEPNMIRLSPEQFKPINPKLGTDGKTMYATCVLCNQRTIVKQSPPRTGFFIRHKSTQQGYRSASDNRPGTPPRVQGRG
jgi:hypothetical protein